MTLTLRPQANSVIFRLLHRIFLFLLLSTLLTSCESKRIIVNGLDEKEANEILVFLSNKGIDGSKVQAATEGAGGGKAILWNISVDSSQGNEAMALLNQAGLPRRRGANLLNIFSNVGLVPSGMQEKVRYQAGLAEQIASTIRKIDGILDADVQISFPDEDPFNPNAPKQKITASVYVKHSGVLDDPNAHLMSRIKRLVAGSINGLDYDNVTVIGDRARFTEVPLGGFSNSEDDRPYVHVWSFVIAKSSLTLFRVVFFSFILVILLLLLALIWILWKVWPLLKNQGGIKSLLNFHPLNGNKEADSLIDSEEKNPDEAEI
ncbi:MAG: type III secretion system inner membrane ring lipoprotein SctJ [Parachlamydiaceae bacterium]